VYGELRMILQCMQWDQPSRRAQRWILKSSAHLASLEALCQQFPEALIIMSHRDPLQTVPSVCSLMTMLHALECDRVDKVEVGRFTAKRWAWNLSRFTQSRARLPSDRFHDVRYRQLVQEPVEEVGRVFARLGEKLTSEAAASINQRLESNRRDKRPAHQYSLGEFGLSEAELLRDFAEYRTAFLNSGP
jgi:hypothetical protein